MSATVNGGCAGEAWQVTQRHLSGHRNPSRSTQHGTRPMSGASPPQFTLVSEEAYHETCRGSSVQATAHSTRNANEVSASGVVWLALTACLPLVGACSILQNQSCVLERAPLITVVHRDSETGEGTWRGIEEDGVRNGLWSLTDAGGVRRALGVFVRGQQSGLWVFWDSSGQIRSAGEYREGIRHGVWLAWDHEGRHDPEVGGFYIDGRKACDLSSGMAGW